MSTFSLQEKSHVCLSYVSFKKKAKISSSKKIYIDEKCAAK